MRKIGIFGGSFNPIHKVHIEIAKASIEQFELSEVFVIPARIPPNKLKEKLMDDGHRFRMVELACEGIDGLTPSDFELKKNSVSYTSETLYFFSETFPRDELYLIVGGDSIRYLEKWNCPEEIFKKAHVLYACRSGDGKKAILEHIDKVLNPEYNHPKISEILFRETEVSSTRIRKEISVGNIEKIREDLDSKVYDYILRYGLYQ